MRLARLPLAPCVLILLACPPSRGTGGDDDDDGDESRNGALVWYDWGSDAEYMAASFVFRPDGTVSCAEWLGGDLEDLGGTWLYLYLYRGVDTPWEQTYYGFYDQENGCGYYYPDHSGAHCATAYSSDGVYLDPVTVTITEWTDDRVQGRVQTDLIDQQFDLTNCGSHTYTGDDDDSDDDDDSAVRSEEREAPPESGPGRFASWRLRLR